MRKYQLRRNHMAIITMQRSGETLRILPPLGAIKTIFLLDGAARVTIRKQDDSTTESETATQN